MFKQTLLCLLGVALGYIGGMTAVGHTQTQSTLDRVTFDVGAGDSKYKQPPDGTWVQRQFRNSERMIDNVQSVGFSWKANSDWTLGLHYAQLGSAFIDADIITCPEDDCSKRAAVDPNRPECKEGYAPSKTCAYRFRSEGSARGVLLSAAYRLFNIGALGVDARIGAFPHQVKWNAVIENMECHDYPQCWRATINQRSSYNVKPVFGIGVKYEPHFLKGGFAQLTFDRFVDIGKHIDATAGFNGNVDRTMLWVGLPLAL